MSQAAVITRLALHELWISYRLLVLLAAHVAAGALVALLPVPVRPTFERLAAGIAVATLVGGAIAAGSMSAERALGRAGWLVTRAVSRGTIILGWFVALAAVSLAGLLASAALGWLAVAQAVPRPDPAAFAAIVVGAAAGSLALLAIGLLLGVVLPVRAAAVGATAAGVLIGAAAWTAAPAAMPLAFLSSLPELERPIATGMQGAGVGLLVAGVALVLARLALRRANL